MTRYLGTRLESGENFFNVGGNSFKALRLCKELGIPVALFFANATIQHLHSALTDHWLKKTATRESDTPTRIRNRNTGAVTKMPKFHFNVYHYLGAPAKCVGAVVVCGMAVRLPGGVNSLNSFWSHLMHGDDLLETLPFAEHLAGGGNERDEGLSSDRAYIRRKGVVCSQGAAAAFDAAAVDVPPSFAGLLPVSKTSDMSAEQRGRTQLLGLQFSLLSQHLCDGSHFRLLLRKFSWS